MRQVLQLQDGGLAQAWAFALPMPMRSIPPDAWKAIAEAIATHPRPFLQDWLHLLHLGLQCCIQKFN